MLKHEVRHCCRLFASKGCDGTAAAVDGADNTGGPCSAANSKGFVWILLLYTLAGITTRLLLPLATSEKPKFVAAKSFCCSCWCWKSATWLPAASDANKAIVIALLLFCCICPVPFTFPLFLCWFAAESWIIGCNDWRFKQCCCCCMEAMLLSNWVCWFCWAVVFPSAENDIFAPAASEFIDGAGEAVCTEVWMQQNEQKKLN